MKASSKRMQRTRNPLLTRDAHVAIISCLLTITSTLGVTLRPVRRKCIRESTEGSTTRVWDARGVLFQGDMTGTQCFAWHSVCIQLTYSVRREPVTTTSVHHDRSEERRVGKECRSRWSVDH